MPRTLFNFLFVIVCWGAIYLPALGSLEIKGEEGRRILPAITMIETGNWLVPQVGSEPYFRKPPLVNWLIATSFCLTGHRNEWTARLPSVLAILVVALAFIFVARASLGSIGSLLAAFFWMVNFGMIEKGRLIEIEAIYVSLFGLAIICWLTCYERQRSPWLTWIVPSVFLGLGALAKGPVHLFFFYAVVVAVLCREGELRKILHPAHFIGILIVIGIFAAWAIPYWRVMQGASLAQNWSVQLTGRFTGDDFKLGNWLLNIPRGLAYFLPWTLLLPLVPGAEQSSARETNLHRALIFGCAVPFLIVNLLPGALPRYSMPVLVPAAWLMAMTLTANKIRPPARWPWPIFSINWKSVLPKFILGFGSLVALLGAIYLLWLVPALRQRSKVKSVAARIDLVMSGSEPLYAVDPDYQPFLFYIKRRVMYASRIDDVPLTARYVLVRPEKENELVKSERWAPRHARRVLDVTDYRTQTVILAEIASADP